MNKKDLKRIEKYNAANGTAFETKAQMRAHEKEAAPQRKAAAAAKVEAEAEQAKLLRASQLEQVRAEFDPCGGLVTKYKAGRAHCHGSIHSISLGSIELPFKKDVQELFFIKSNAQMFFPTIGLSLQGVIALDNSQNNKYVKALNSLNEIVGAEKVYITFNSVYFTVSKYIDSYEIKAEDAFSFSQATGERFEPFNESELRAKPTQGVDTATSDLIDAYAEHTINHFERNI
tara:strand:- start:30 stop:722 length:693 start_codon:yes stop_codon:yes gene_type:complete